MLIHLFLFYERNREYKGFLHPIGVCTSASNANNEEYTTDVDSKSDGYDGKSSPAESAQGRNGYKGDVADDDDARKILTAISPQTGLT